MSSVIRILVSLYASFVTSIINIEALKGRTFLRLPVESTVGGKTVYSMREISEFVCYAQWTTYINLTPLDWGSSPYGEYRDFYRAVAVFDHGKTYAVDEYISYLMAEVGFSREEGVAYIRAMDKVALCRHKF